jgi:hypothetical protein
MALRPNNTGVCSHCGIAVRFEPVSVRRGRTEHGQINPLGLYTGSGHRLFVDSAGCPACGKVLLQVIAVGGPDDTDQPADIQLWPDTFERPVPPEVEGEAPSVANDFREAVAVLPKSKKASAALARRCLQSVLVHKGQVKSKDLANQIDEVLPHLPTSLADNVDAIRQVGNFAAHPLKSKSSGEIVEVEEGEAEWLLDVLEELFDFYYVAPAKAATKRTALNAKLASFGKPALKSSI